MTAQRGPNVPAAIKAVVYERIPEATLAETGMAMILASLGELHGLTIVDIVEQFPAKLAEAGLPAKLPPWVVKLAMRLDRDARDAMLWRYKDRPLLTPGPEKSWHEIRKLERGETIAPPPRAVSMAKPIATPQPEPFSIFD